MVLMLRSRVYVKRECSHVWCVCSRGVQGREVEVGVYITAGRSRARERVSAASGCIVKGVAGRARGEYGKSQC